MDKFVFYVSSYCISVILWETCILSLRTVFQWFQDEYVFYVSLNNISVISDELVFYVHINII